MRVKKSDDLHPPPLDSRSHDDYTLSLSLVPFSKIACTLSTLYCNPSSRDEWIDTVRRYVGLDRPARGLQDWDQQFEVADETDAFSHVVKVSYLMS